MSTTSPCFRLNPQDSLFEEKLTGKRQPHSSAGSAPRSSLPDKAEPSRALEIHQPSPAPRTAPAATRAASRKNPLKGSAKSRPHSQRPSNAPSEPPKKAPSKPARQPPSKPLRNGSAGELSLAEVSLSECPIIFVKSPGRLILTRRPSCDGSCLAETAPAQSPPAQPGRPRHRSHRRWPRG